MYTLVRAMLAAIGVALAVTARMVGARRVLQDLEQTVRGADCSARNRRRAQRGGPTSAEGCVPWTDPRLFLAAGDAKQ